MTGGLSGIAGRMDGVFPAAPATPTVGAAARMPARLASLHVKDGRVQGLDLPSLGEREMLAAWKAAIPRGAVYVRFLDRRTAPPIAHVQRLARLGEVWLDCAVPDGGTALDLQIAGAHRLVVWVGAGHDSDELLETLGDAAAVGWDGKAPWTAAVAKATELGVPLLCSADPPLPAEGLHVYRVDLSSTRPSTVTRIMQPAASTMPLGLAPAEGVVAGLAAASLADGARDADGGGEGEGGQDAGDGDGAKGQGGEGDDADARPEEDADGEERHADDEEGDADDEDDEAAGR